jgi:hypothetical protein
MDLTKVKDNAIDGLALALGVSSSVILMALAKGKIPYWLEPFVGIIPGLGLAIMVNDKRVNEFGKGFIAVGILDGVTKGVSQIPALQSSVGKFLPKIEGLGRLGEMAVQEPAQLLSGFAGLGMGASDSLLS